jgi:hypothetical protein
VNPATGETIREYGEAAPEQVRQIALEAACAWRLAQHVSTNAPSAASRR